MTLLKKLKKTRQKTRENYKEMRATLKRIHISSVRRKKLADLRQANPDLKMKFPKKTPKKPKPNPFKGHPNIKWKG